MRLLVITLERYGYAVRGFTNPLDALAALDDFAPDAIITDVSMPVMNGIEFCRRVRLDARFTGTPVIFLSALAERQDVRSGMNVGADDYLTKPFSRDEIIEALQARLRLAAQRDATPEPKTPNLRARALGGSVLEQHGQPVSWGSRKAAEFFFLLLEHPNGVTTWEAAETLWPEKDEQKASSVFHTTLHRLRKAVGDDTVQARNRRYYLNERLELRYDVLEYTALGERARREANADLYAAAAALYQGEYLSGVDSEWCVERRETLHAQHLEVLLGATRAATAREDWSVALRYAQAASQHDPYNDGVWDALARLYERTGDPVRAGRARNKLEGWN